MPCLLSLFSSWISLVYSLPPVLTNIISVQIVLASQDWEIGGIRRILSRGWQLLPVSIRVENLALD
jgi:hypothetical protein